MQAVFLNEANGMIMVSMATFDGVVVDKVRVDKISDLGYNKRTPFTFLSCAQWNSIS